MGYFAILKDQTSDDVVVQCCHINYWSLPSLIPGRRLFYFDVGVELLNRGPGDVGAFQVALPFRAEPGAWPDKTKLAYDLYADFADQEVAELIFGGPVEQSTSGDVREIRLGAQPTSLFASQINSARVELVGEQRIDSSVFKIPLQASLTPGSASYYRFRWRVFGAQPMWRWKRLNGGARMDFRVADVRESSYVTQERELRSRVLEVCSLNFFLMASPKLQLHLASPDFHNLRILEPHAWARYLKGAARAGRPRGLLVYHWKRGTRGDLALDPINVNQPFKVFADFNRQASAVWWIQMARSAIAFLAVLLLIGYGSTALQDLHHVHVNVKAILAFIGLSSVIAIATFIGKARSWAADKFRGPRMFLRRVERGVLGIIGPR